LGASKTGTKESLQKLSFSSQEDTQMFTNKKLHSSETRSTQASNEVHSEPNKIGASTAYDFSAKNLTPHGGLLPVATMLEKIGLEKQKKHGMNSLIPQ
jgi:hypothetical protein